MEETQNLQLDQYDSNVVIYCCRPFQLSQSQYPLPLSILIVGTSASTSHLQDRADPLPDLVVVVIEPLDLIRRHQPEVDQLRLERDQSDRLEL